MDIFTISKQYGRDELIFLLRLMRAFTLPGLGDDPLAGFTQEEATAALMAAEQSLKARGIIDVSDKEERVKLDQITYILVGSCIRPLASIYVSSIGAGGTGAIKYYHISPHLTVEHSFPEVGVDGFFAAPNPIPMLSRILDLMALDGSKPAAAPFEIEQSILDQAKAAAQAGNRKSALDCLKKSSADSRSATGFVGTLMEPLHNSSVIKVRHAHAGSADGGPIEGFATLQGVSGLWALVPKTEDERRVVLVAPIGAEEAKRRVSALVPSQVDSQQEQVPT